MDFASTMCFGESGRDHRGVLFLPASFGSPRPGCGGCADLGARARRAASSGRQDVRSLGSGHRSEVELGLLHVWRLRDLDAFLLGFGIKASLMGYLTV